MTHWRRFLIPIRVAFSIEIISDYQFWPNALRNYQPWPPISSLNLFAAHSDRGIPSASSTMIFKLKHS